MCIYVWYIDTNNQKKKKGLVINKMKIENAEMRVIKWERVWNDNRKEKNGREIIFVITKSQVAKNNKVIVIAKPKKT